MALWVRIGTHSDFEYLKASDITTLNKKIVATLLTLNMCGVSHPGTWFATNNADVMRPAIQKPTRSANSCSMNPR